MSVKHAAPHHLIQAPLHDCVGISHHRRIYDIPFFATPVGGPIYPLQPWGDVKTFDHCSHVLYDGMLGKNQSYNCHAVRIDVENATDGDMRKLRSGCLFVMSGDPSGRAIVKSGLFGVKIRCGTRRPTLSIPLKMDVPRGGCALAHIGFRFDGVIFDRSFTIRLFLCGFLGEY